MTEDEAVRLLESTGRYRLLRLLEPQDIYAEPSPEAVIRVGALVDVETTGLNRANGDSIIELGVVLFEYAAVSGTVLRVVEERSWFEDPGQPIPAEITKLTGITDEMVAGQSIPVEEAEALLARAHLVIAHNAAFDRGFVEALLPVAAKKPWACSYKEVSWSGEGFAGGKLEYLLQGMGFFTTGHHRAGEDCRILLHVLAQELRSGRTGLQMLLEAARRRTLRVYAVGSAFADKDKLKAAGYAWSDGTDGRQKAWWIEIAEELETETIQKLAELSPTASPKLVHLTAIERYSERAFGTEPRVEPV